MLLYIILFFVAINLMYSVSEGFNGIEGTVLDLGTCKERNNLYGKWNPTKKLVTNDNDALYYNYQNILSYASGYC